MAPPLDDELLLPAPPLEDELLPPPLLELLPPTPEELELDEEPPPELPLLLDPLPVSPPEGPVAVAHPIYKNPTTREESE